MSGKDMHLAQEEGDDLLDQIAEPENGAKPMSYLRACQALGNHDQERGKTFFFELATLLNAEREQHPLFAIGPYQALGVIGAEYRKLVRAIEHGTPEESHAKALMLLVQTLRFLLDEHRVRGWKKRE